LVIVTRLLASLIDFSDSELNSLQTTFHTN